MIYGAEMEFKDLAEKRYSNRGFLNKPIEKEKIESILENIKTAPSAANRQPWKVYIVSDESIRKELVKSYQRDWFAEAPVIVVFVGLTDANWKRQDGADYLLCDVTLLADYFVLSATEQGLGTCYIAAFDEKVAHSALNLKENEKVLLMTPLGYPREGCTRERNRIDISEIVNFI